MAQSTDVVCRKDGGSNPSPSTIVLAGHQPVYLPGIIVMAKIAMADQFMWVGHCDYQHRSWHSRNYIRGYRGPIRLSVPVIKNSGPSINDTLIDGDSWKRKHLVSIEHNYCGRPFFKQYFPELRASLLQKHHNLADLNISLANLLCHWLEIDTQIHYSENWNIQGHKTAMLVDMCHKIRATDYLSSPGETYVNKEEMNGYGHRFMKFRHPEYDQGGPFPFMPNLSVIDLVFNCGPRSGDIVRGAHE